jgi:hypothetical protein
MKDRHHGRCQYYLMDDGLHGIVKKASAFLRRSCTIAGGYLDVGAREVVEIFALLAQYMYPVSRLQLLTGTGPGPGQPAHKIACFKHPFEFV